MAAKNLVLNIKEKDIYDKATKKKVSIQFYLNKMQMFYNNNMNSVDVANQLWNPNNF